MELFSVAWTSPSNIALIKYWGKLQGQIPANPSLSFTLNKAKTYMEISAIPKKNHEQLQFDFVFHGSENKKFKLKIENILNANLEYFPWLKNYSLKIKSENTFPHSSGIASSASSMSALALCLLSLDKKINNRERESETFLKEASALARKASGSAARSIYPFLTVWGKIENIVGTSDLHSHPFPLENLHSVFKSYCDAIIIVDSEEKIISSRAGHELMNEHLFAKERFQRAKENLAKLIFALESGDLEVFVKIVEEEAMMLHALMMTSSPSFILLKPSSLLIIEKIKSYREKTKTPVCFTIDAGPNIHLLYPRQYKKNVEIWIENELRSLFDVQDIIYDEMGQGPVEIIK